ncbi:MAG: DNA polymerase III subunit delta [Muribaculaceae bacterium]|nr:DNA polymerase III subunit delta [Muribaculaceae bacterium]
MATTTALTYEALCKQLALKQYSPVYLLHGEEGYFTDALLDKFEHIVPEEEKAFNQYVLYAPDTDIDRVIDLCRRCPMMSERQVVILKEAQAINALTLNRLHSYVSHPTPSTVLVIACRGAIAKGKDLLAAVHKNGTIFESKKIRDAGAESLITERLRQHRFIPDAKAVAMIREHVGTDLSRLFNEADKLAALLPPGAKVTPEIVEKHIGVSKDYNNFELIDAIAARDGGRAFRIAEYFAANPKNNSAIASAAMLFGFFSDLLICQFSPDKSERGLMDALHAKSAWSLKKFQTGMSRYNAWQSIEIIGALRDFDRKCKGKGSRQGEHALFRELIFHILNAPGKIDL